MKNPRGCLFWRWKYYKWCVRKADRISDTDVQLQAITASSGTISNISKISNLVNVYVEKNRYRWSFLSTFYIYYDWSILVLVSSKSYTAVIMSFQTYTMVRPEHLNHHGFLFGGQLLKWVDEYAWLAAAKDNPGCKLVTRAMDSMEFVRSAPQGSILRFDAYPVHRGHTSLRYKVEVFCESDKRDEYRILSTIVTFVNVDADGHKIPLCDSFCSEDDAS